MAVNEIERPLREEIAEIKEMLESMKKDIAAIKDNIDADISEKSKRKTFYTFLGQYDEEVDISEEPEPWDPEPYIPVVACSQEAQFEAMRKHDEWVKRQQSNYVNQV